MVITLTRPLPPQPRPMDRAVRVLAGCYETEAGRETYVAAQVGRVVGWSFAEWDGPTPVAAILRVEVR